MSDAYLGVSASDVASQYRHHAALIADGDQPKPTHAMLIERQADERFVVRGFGPDAPEPIWFDTFDELLRHISPAGH